MATFTIRGIHTTLNIKANDNLDVKCAKKIICTRVFITDLLTLKFTIVLNKAFVLLKYAGNKITIRAHNGGYGKLNTLKYFYKNQ